jgi:hypothetical protein
MYDKWVRPCSVHRNHSTSNETLQTGSFYSDMLETSADDWLRANIYKKDWCENPVCSSYHKILYYNIILLLFKLKVLR